MQKTLLAMLRTVIPSVSDSLFSASMLSGISHTLTWTGLVTLAVFWWTVTGWMNSLRNAVTTMFGDCTQALNVEMQNLLNPPQKGKPQLQSAARVFRVGDKVMQVRNNYEIVWNRIGG